MKDGVTHETNSEVAIRTGSLDKNEFSAASKMGYLEEGMIVNWHDRCLQREKNV